MTNRSLYSRLEPLLTQVSKPVQYIGGEVNSITKGDVGIEVRWALMYPDVYEVGQPNQGLAILYEILNEPEWLSAERTFSIWPDLAALMREHSLPQFTWETHRPVADVDLFGISFSTELGYTNLLEALDLAGLALHAADRGEDAPLVIVGGHAAFNPEPIADFIDAAVLGDGEAAALEISRRTRAWKEAGRPGGRVGLLAQLAADGTAYVPQFYRVDYLAEGPIEAVTPLGPDVPPRVSKHVLNQLDQWPYPKRPIVPLAETVHERYSVEIFRGCSRGCRFCQAGMVSRPVRERSVATIGDMAAAGLAATGLEEIGLLSLSSADHSEIAEITSGLADRYADSFVSLSLPSTRVDAFNIDLAEQLSRNGRRSGLTFAPEGGTERLRRVINKQVNSADLIDTVSTAFGRGWRQVKLYFMCGLPTETDEDVVAIADLAAQVIEAGRRAAGTRDVRCTISIGGFVPKAHTPFQWVGQTDADTVNRRLRMLKDAVRSDRRYGRFISVRYHEGEPGQIEGLLSRGDRRVGEVIEAVWRDGGILDGWSEHFSYQRWVAAADRVLSGHGLSLAWYTERTREKAEVLPWSHLDAGLDPEWLWWDYRDALNEVEVEDCRWSGCYDCGVCPGLGTEIQIGPTGSDR